MRDAPVRYSFCAIHYDSWPSTRWFVESLWRDLWDDAEVVVVDGGSTDGSREYLEAFAREYPNRFRLVDDPGGNRGRGRDLAWRAARGDVIVHVDADRSFREGGLAELRALYESKPPRHVVVDSRRDGVQMGGANLIPRDVLERIGGYDRSLTYYEDVDMNERSARLAPIEHVVLDLYDRNWTGKMRRPTYLPRYYYGMFRDGARMGKGFWNQARRAVRRPLSWPFLVPGAVGWLVGRMSPPPLSRR